DGNLQFRVACKQPPPIRDSILRRQLRAVGFGFLPVGEHDGKGVGRNEPFHAADVVVFVIKGRHRERNPRVGLDAIPQFVRQQFFGDKVGSASEKERWVGGSKKLGVNS